MPSIPDSEENAAKSSNAPLTSPVDINLANLEASLESGIRKIMSSDTTIISEQDEYENNRVFEDTGRITFKDVSTSASSTDEISMDEYRQDRVNDIVDDELKCLEQLQAVLSEKKPNNVHTSESELIVYNQLKEHPSCILDRTFINDVSALLQRENRCSTEYGCILPLRSLPHVAVPGVHAALEELCAQEIARLRGQRDTARALAKRVAIDSSWVLYDFLLLYNVYQQHIQQLSFSALRCEQGKTGGVMKPPKLGTQCVSYFSKSAQLGSKIGKAAPHPSTLWQGLVRLSNILKKPLEGCAPCFISQYLRCLPHDDAHKHALVNLSERRSYTMHCHTCKGETSHDKKSAYLKPIPIAPDLAEISPELWTLVCQYISSHWDTLSIVFPFITRIAKKCPPLPRQSEQIILPVPLISPLREINQGNLRLFRWDGLSEQLHAVFTEWNGMLKGLETSPSNDQSAVFIGPSSAEKLRHSLVEITRDIHILQGIKGKCLQELAELGGNADINEELCVMEDEDSGPRKVRWGGYDPTSNTRQEKKKKKQDNNNNQEDENNQVVCIAGDYDIVNSAVCVDAEKQRTKALSVSSLCVSKCEDHKSTRHDQHTCTIDLVEQSELEDMNDNSLTRVSKSSNNVSNLADQSTPTTTTEPASEPLLETNFVHDIVQSDSVSTQPQHHTPSSITTISSNSTSSSSIGSPPPLEYTSSAVYTPIKPHNSIIASSVGGISAILQTLQPYKPSTPVINMSEIETKVQTMSLHEKNSLLLKYGLQSDSSTATDGQLIKCLVWDRQNVGNSSGSSSSSSSNNNNINNSTLEPPRIQRLKMNTSSYHTCVKSAEPGLEHLFSCWTCAQTNWLQKPRQENLLEYMASQQSIDVAVLHTQVSQCENESNLLALLERPIAMSSTMLTKCVKQVNKCVDMYLALLQQLDADQYSQSQPTVQETRAVLGQYIDGRLQHWLNNVESVLLAFFKMYNLDVRQDSYVARRLSSITGKQPPPNTLTTKQWLDFAAVTNSTFSLLLTSCAQAKLPKKVQQMYQEESGIPYHGSLLNM